MWETFFCPTSINKTLEILSEIGSQARIIAGGTDLLIELERKVRKVHALVDVSRISGLNRVWLDSNDLIHLGPAVTHNQAAGTELLQQRAAALVQACSQVGSAQLRNTATVAGNLITASPANDTIPVLRALNAHLTLQSLRGVRTISLADFYLGVRKTVLEPDEMVTDIYFPALQENQKSVFMKLGLRRAHAISLVNTAVVLKMAGDAVTGVRITLGSVAPTIIRAFEAEAALEGCSLDNLLIEEAAQLAAMAASPIDDVRAGAEYRRETVRVLVRRALESIRDGGSDPTPSHPKLWGRGDGLHPALSGETRRFRVEEDRPIECTVNGERVSVSGAADKTLLSMLRENLGLTGSKEGCGEGECGACTVWMDGMAVLACLVPAPRAFGTEIVTVEGLSRDGELHPVQQAFVEDGAVQCGYCTPGFIMSAAKLLEEIAHPDREQIVEGVSGNLCRCTGYYKIFQAIERAAQSEQE